MASGQREDKLSIDTFIPNSSPFISIIDTYSFPATYSTSQTSANVLGGERDIFFIISEAEVNSVLYAQVSSGQLSIALPLNTIGSVVLRYDGTNGDGPIDETGLGELNLLDNGADAFTFNINNDLAISAVITVYSSDGSSEASIDIPESTSETTYNIYFSDFVGTANFEAIGAIELSLDSMSESSALDLSLKNFRTSATMISPTLTSTTTFTTSNTPTVTASSASSNTPTTTATITPTVTPTMADESSVTVTPTMTPTFFGTETPTPTISFTDSSITPTPTNTIDESITNTPTPTRTVNSSETTNTASPTPTGTMSSSDSTPTPTSTIDSSETTNTASPTPTNTINESIQNTPTPTSTIDSSETTNTPSPTPTGTMNPSDSTPTPTSTIDSSETTNTASPTPNSTGSGNPTPTRTVNSSGTTSAASPTNSVIGSSSTSTITRSVNPSGTTSATSPTVTRSVNPSGTTSAASPTNSVIVSSSTSTITRSVNPSGTTSATSPTPTRTINSSGATPTISQSPTLSTPSNTPTIRSQTITPTVATTPSPVPVVSVTVSADDEEVVVEQPELGVLVVADPLVFGINSTVTVSGVTRILPDAVAVVSSAIEINLFDENGNLIQPNGNVIICFPPVSGGDPDRYCLAYLDEVSNEWICDNNDVEETDGELCSSAPHFTIFALIDKVILDEMSDSSSFSIPITSLPTVSDYSSFTYSNPSPISEFFSSFTPGTLSFSPFSSLETTELSTTSTASSFTFGASMFILFIQLLF